MDSHRVVIKGSPLTFLDGEGRPTVDEAAAARLSRDQAGERARRHGAAIAVQGEILPRMSGIVLDVLIAEAARRAKR